MFGENVIEVSHLNKVYKIFARPVDRIKESLLPFHRRYSRDFYALRDLSFSVRRGETLGIVGENGAGKSTLLKIITGVLTPTSGEVRVQGRIASLLELGAGFNPEMTGMENVYMNGDIMGIPHEVMAQRVPDIVAFADIGDFIHQPVKVYSSGMFARLAFAVNAFIEPDILIVDEALSVGDIGFQSKCYRKFREMQKKGITILLVTHDTNAVLNYCSQAVFMEGGRVVTEGSPKEVVDAYKRRLAQKEQKRRASSGRAGVEQAHEEYASEMLWKEKLQLNKNFLEYGDKDFEIIDFGVFNREGEISSLVNNSQMTTLKMKVKVHRRVEQPIFAFNIKDIQGVEVLGTNTLLMGTEIGELLPGQTVVVSFQAPISIHSGKYQLSFGCTEYVSSGLQVHHRLYDVAFLDVVADRETCGIADVQPAIEVICEG